MQIVIWYQVQANPNINENFVLLELISEFVHIKFQFLCKSYVSIFLERLQIYVYRNIILETYNYIVFSDALIFLLQNLT